MAVIIEDAPIVSSEANKISYPSISGLMGRVGLNVTTRAIQSDNFVTGSSGAGWQLTAEGNLEATSGTFRGALAATSGTIAAFTIGGTTLSATGITLDSSGAIVTATTIRTSTGATRVNLNASTIQFYDGSSNNDLTISIGGSTEAIRIVHRAGNNGMYMSYAATGARGNPLIKLEDTNQVSGASTDSAVLFINRTVDSTSAKNLVQFYNVGGTGAVLDIQQNSTAGVAATRLYQQDVDKTAIFIRNGTTAVTEANIGTLEVNTGATGMVGIYITPLANSAHMRWFAGSAPATPVEGDFWYDGTNLKFRDSTATKTLSWT